MDNLIDFPIKIRTDAEIFGLYPKELNYEFQTSGILTESIKWEGHVKYWKQHNCFCKILDLMREGCTCGGL